MTRIARIELIRWDLPMRRSFVTAHGAKKLSRNLLVAVRLDDGTSGYGEASESLAWADQTQQRMRSSLTPLADKFTGYPIARAQQLVAKARRALPEMPAAAGAIECALLDALSRSEGIPLWQWLGAQIGGKKTGPAAVTTGLTVSAWPARESGRFARDNFRRGFRTFKVKVTADLDADLRRVLAVHKAAPKAALWIDGNQAFSPRGAIRFGLRLRSLRLPVALFEQPVARQNAEGLAEVQRALKLPVAADESAATLEQARRLIRRKQAAVINVKLAKSGLLGALDVIKEARKSRVSVMIGCMAESSLGLSPSVHLACGTGAFRFIDLDSAFLVRSPACLPGFSAKGPRLSVGRAPGAGSSL